MREIFHANEINMREISHEKFSLCLWDTVWRTEEYWTSPEIESMYTIQKKIKIILLTSIHHVALTQSWTNSKAASAQQPLWYTIFFAVVPQSGIIFNSAVFCLCPRPNSTC